MSGDNKVTLVAWIAGCITIAFMMGAAVWGPKPSALQNCSNTRDIKDSQFCLELAKAAKNGN